MDISTIDDVIFWIDRQPDFEYTDTGEVLRRVKAAEFDDDAKRALQDLPPRRWTRPELVAEAREVLIPHVPLR